MVKVKESMSELSSGLWQFLNLEVPFDQCKELSEESSVNGTSKGGQFRSHQNMIWASLDS